MSIQSLSYQQHRYVVVDVLRGISILGMIWAHTKGLAPQMLPDAVMGVLSQLSGSATPLFMLIAGTTIAILTRHKMNWSQRHRFRLEYFLRGVGLIALGLILLPWGGRVDIVLAYLGVTFILAVPFMFFDSKWLILISATMFVASPLLMKWVQLTLATQPDLLYSRVSSHPLAFLIEWTFTGRSYHATWLLPFLLLGIVCGRLLLADKFPGLAVFCVSLLITGIVYLVFVYPQNNAGNYLRGGYPEMTYDLGRALMLYGAGNALFSAPWSATRGRALAGCTPLALAGRMPLTLYVFHVIQLFAIEHSGIMGTAPAAFWPFAVLFSCLTFAAVWGLSLGVGPIERLLGVFSLRHPPSSMFTRHPIAREELGFESRPARFDSSRR